jgi:hypothetical protein
MSARWFSTLASAGRRVIGGGTGAAPMLGEDHDSDDGGGGSSSTAIYVHGDAAPPSTTLARIGVLPYQRDNDSDALCAAFGLYASQSLFVGSWRLANTRGMLPAVNVGGVNCAPLTRALAYTQRYVPLADAALRCAPCAATLSDGEAFPPADETLRALMQRRRVSPAYLLASLEAMFTVERITADVSVGSGIEGDGALSMAGNGEDTCVSPVAAALLCAGVFVAAGSENSNGSGGAVDMWTLPERVHDATRALVRLCAQRGTGVTGDVGGGSTLADAQQRQSALVAKAAAGRKRGGAGAKRGGAGGDLASAVEAASRFASSIVAQNDAAPMLAARDVHVVRSDENGDCVVQALFTFSVHYAALRDAPQRALGLNLGSQYHEWAVAVGAAQRDVLVSRVEFVAAMKSLAVPLAVEAWLGAGAGAQSQADAAVLMERDRHVLLECDPLFLARRARDLDVDPLSMLAGAHRRTLRPMHASQSDESFEREFALRRYELIARAGGAAVVVEQYLKYASATTTATALDGLLTLSSACDTAMQSIVYYALFLARVHEYRATLPVHFYDEIRTAYEVDVDAYGGGGGTTTLEALADALLSRATGDGWRLSVQTLRRIARVMDIRLPTRQALRCKLSECGVLLRRGDGRDWIDGLPATTGTDLDGVDYVAVSVNFYMRVVGGGS